MGVLGVIITPREEVLRYCYYVNLWVIAVFRSKLNTMVYIIVSLLFAAHFDLYTAHSTSMVPVKLLMTVKTLRRRGRGCQ
jgi:hypothetical protein